MVAGVVRSPERTAERRSARYGASPPPGATELLDIEAHAQHTSMPAPQEQQQQQNLMGPWGLRPPRRAAGCTGQSRPCGDHDQRIKENVWRASEDGALADIPPFNY
eukprot:scaffold913_cov73-Phaeocystis_antarctica.AAC.4